MPKIPFALSHELRGPNLQVARVTPMSLRTGGLKGDAIQQAAETALAVIEKKVQILEAETAAEAMTNAQLALIQAETEFKKNPQDLGAYTAKVQSIIVGATSGLSSGARAKIGGRIAVMGARAVSNANNIHTDFTIKEGKNKFEAGLIKKGDIVAGDPFNIILRSEQIGQISGELLARHGALGKGLYSLAELEVDLKKAEVFLDTKRADKMILLDPADFLEKTSGPKGQEWIAKNLPGLVGQEDRIRSLRAAANGEAGRLEKDKRGTDKVAEAAAKQLEVNTYIDAAIQNDTKEGMQAALDKGIAEKLITSETAKLWQDILDVEENGANLSPDKARIWENIQEGVRTTAARSSNPQIAFESLLASVAEHDIPYEVVQPFFKKLQRQIAAPEEYEARSNAAKLAIGEAKNLTIFDQKTYSDQTNAIAAITKGFFDKFRDKGFGIEESIEKAVEAAQKERVLRQFYSEAPIKMLDPEAEEQRRKDPEALLHFLKTERAKELYTPEQIDRMLNVLQQDAAERKVKEPEKREKPVMLTPQLEADLRDRLIKQERYSFNPLRQKQTIVNMIIGRTGRVRAFIELPEADKKVVMDYIRFGEDGVDPKQVKKAKRLVDIIAEERAFGHIPSSEELKHGAEAISPEVQEGKEPLSMFGLEDLPGVVPQFDISNPQTYSILGMVEFVRRFMNGELEPEEQEIVAGVTEEELPPKASLSKGSEKIKVQ